jgi:hypothetical protein
LLLAILCPQPHGLVPAEFRALSIHRDDPARTYVVFMSQVKPMGWVGVTLGCETCRCTLGSSFAQQHDLHFLLLLLCFISCPLYCLLL